MSAADKRITELLERWLASVELHARYLELDDAAYAKAQDWPKHQRPTKWVVELARARLIELRRHLEERRAKGDAAFAESLELMSFLTTLLGSEHIERFVPLAIPRPPAATPSAQTVDDTVVAAPSAKAGPSRTSPSTAKSTGDTTTKQVLPIRQKTGKASVRPAVPHAAKASIPPVQARAAPSQPTKSPRVPDKVQATVIADAVRFLSWGREWPQLASSIARLADRPPEQEIWKILREHRTDIENQARRPPD